MPPAHDPSTQPSYALWYHNRNHCTTDCTKPIDETLWDSVARQASVAMAIRELFICIGTRQQDAKLKSGRLEADHILIDHGVRDASNAAMQQCSKQFGAKAIKANFSSWST